ncbi:MAG: hypothetical protein ACE5E7_04365 [Anaerolineae bacterium]
MKRLLLILILLVLLAVPVRAALAAPTQDTTVVEAGETVNNDVILFDGDLEVKEGGQINGDVTLFNGGVTIAGIVDGDVVLFNGDLEAESTAVIRGDCVVLNGRIEDRTENGLGCTAVENLPDVISPLSALSGLRPFQANSVGRITTSSAVSSFFGGLAEAAGRGLVLGMLAFIIASLAPGHVSQMGAAVRRKPVASGAVGLLTAVAIPSLVLLLLPISIILTFICIGLLGFPIMFALMVGLVVGALLGWVALGQLLGERLAELLRLKSRNLPVTAALGTTTMTFVFSLMGAIPFIVGEALAVFLAVCIGLGAAALTQFGTRPYPAVVGRPNEEKVSEILAMLPVDEVTGLKEEQE